MAKRPKIFEYMVIGLYADNMQRFADSVRAADAFDAEKKFIRKFPNVIIAGICRVEAVDNYGDKHMVLVG